LLACAEGELTGQPLDAFLGGESEPIAPYLKRCLGSGEPTIGSAATRCRHAAPRMMRLEGSRVVLAPGSAPMILLQMRDREAAGSKFVALNQRLDELSREVARRQRAEDALAAKMAEMAQADRHKDRFIALLSHELRNPLAPIRTLLEVLRRDARPDQVTRSVDMMERHVLHLIRLLDDLLDLSRIATGKIRINLGAVPLRDVLEIAASAMRPRIEAKGQALEVSAPAGIMIHADADRMRQVVGNLLDNASKFTPAGGRISAVACIESGRAVVRVRDSGPGIAPQLAQRLFSFFTQGEAPADRAQDGLGLGLALARNLMELQGGELALAPDAAGGAEFVATIPLARSHCEDASHAPAGAHQRTVILG
jgi:signal transduction histidine kinase